MSCFAVIKVNQCYDYVEGAECLESFDNEDDANECVQEWNQKIRESQRAKLDYIEKWVDECEVPEALNYQHWKSYLEQWHPFGAMYVFPKDFKEELKRYLRTHHATYEGYNPPEAIYDMDNLFVVEIK